MEGVPVNQIHGGALVIHPDGRIEKYELNQRAADRGSVFAAIYLALDCDTIESVHLTSVIHAWFDENGVATRPVNPMATALAERHGYIHQPYFGPALICAEDADGEPVDMTADQLQAQISTLEEITRAVPS